MGDSTEKNSRLDRLKRLLKPLTIPGWISLAWKWLWTLIGWIGNLDVVHEHLPLVRRIAERLSHPVLSYLLFAVGIVWILLAIFYGAALERNFATWKIVAAATSILVAATTVTVLASHSPSSSTVGQDRIAEQPVKSLPTTRDKGATSSQLSSVTSEGHEPPAKESQDTSKKSSGSKEANGSSKEAGNTINNAPNGIAISGGSVNNPVVNNTFTDVFPRSGEAPNVNFCIVSSKQVGEEYQTTIRVRTDSPISSPYWAFFFDSPVSGATVGIENIKEPFGSTNGHPFPSSAKLEALGTLPPKSLLLMRPEFANATVAPENVLKIQITEIGNPFGGPYRPWEPTDVLTFTIHSIQPANLLAVASGYQREFVEENMTNHCD